MRLSLVTRLTIVVVGIIVASFAVWTAVAFRTTAVTFVAERHRLQAASDDAADSLVQDVDAAYATGGWPAVQRTVSALGPPLDRGVLVLDEALQVRAASHARWEHAVVTDEGAAGLRVSVRTTGGPEAFDADLVGVSSTRLTEPDGTPWGRLVRVPGSESEDGRSFASRVWRTAAVWLLGVVAIAVGLLVWVLRTSLAPIVRLTRAARELQAGRTPAALSGGGSAEVGELVDAFNAAAAAVHETHRQRRQLVADVAHELRTPLTNVRGQVETLAAGLVDDIPAIVDSLQTEVRMLERLIDDLQQLALADAGALRLVPQPLPLRETLATLVAPLARAVDAQWTCDGPTDLMVLADEDRLRQVVSNLVENAARHVPRGLAISVRCWRDADVAVFQVTDNGPGVPATHRTHIFERFYRAEPSRGRHTGGAGLGLTIVRALVEAMGGSIRYVAMEGAGARFEIRLPRSEAG